MKKTKILTLALMGLALGTSMSSCTKTKNKMGAISTPADNDDSGSSSTCSGPGGCGSSNPTKASSNTKNPRK